jgi:hypothetical protein
MRVYRYASISCLERARHTVNLRATIGWPVFASKLIRVQTYGGKVDLGNPATKVTLRGFCQETMRWRV